ncbi:cation:proton antiporter [Synechococcus sp. PCC 7336]|uniref:cation:proton antiporter n=1 Tax=Synechococcus sp. PCC 7336 TaxID=195250 RepID=UPI00034B0D83|nr:cation:proton antiporter [Synechococcus sp. PCC 7336]
MMQPVLLLAIVLLLAAIAPHLSRLLRIPSLVLSIGAGALLGTHGLGLLERDPQLILLERVGLLFVMLLAGLQMNLSNLGQLGRRSLAFGGLTFALPFVAGVATGYWADLGLYGSVLLGLMYSPHMLVAYPIAVQLGISGLESVNVAIGGTVVTTAVTLGGYAVVSAAVAGSVGIWLWVRLLVLLPLLAIGAWIGLARLGDRLLTRKAQSSAERISFVLACLFGVSALTEWLGVDAVVGAFIVGLSLNRVVCQDRDLMQQLDGLGNGLFIPAFLVSVGVLCNLRIVATDPGSLGLAAAIVVGAVLSKWVAAWVAAQQFGYGGAEAMVAFGLTMSRAALILVIGLFAREAGLLDGTVFNALILYVTVTCLVGPIVTDAWGARVAKRSQHPEALPGVDCD